MPIVESDVGREPGPSAMPVGVWSDSASITLLGAVAIVAPLTLLISGAAAPTPALAASGVAAAAACVVMLTRRFRRAVAPVESLASRATVSPVAGTSFESLIVAFEDPMLIVAGGTPADPGHRRFIFANAAARGLFHLQRDQGPLTTAIRAPDVLAAVERAFLGVEPGTPRYESGGVQNRTWQVRATRIPTPAPTPAGAEPILVLLSLRDDTEAVRSERTRADFLANASHELRTPLASLAGFIETLRGHAKDDPEARDRFLSIMQRQAERMRRLIDDLMSLSRIELAEHVAPSGDVDLCVAVIDVIDALTPLATDRNIRLEKQLPPTGSAVAIGDRDQIVQVIQNLVENALKYAPDGGSVRIVVAVAQDGLATPGAVPAELVHLDLLVPDRAGGQHYAMLKVHDDGCGIARAHLLRLTERFYRVEGQKSGDYPGTGLGLAIVKHIVNRHRGGLTVNSAEGVGTIFTVYLPIARA